MVLRRGGFAGLRTFGVPVPLPCKGIFRTLSCERALSRFVSLSFMQFDGAALSTAPYCGVKNVWDYVLCCKREVFGWSAEPPTGSSSPAADNFSMLFFFENCRELTLNSMRCLRSCLCLDRCQLDRDLET